MNFPPPPFLVLKLLDQYGLVGKGWLQTKTKKTKQTKKQKKQNTNGHSRPIQFVKVRRRAVTVTQKLIHHSNCRTQLGVVMTTRSNVNSAVSFMSCRVVMATFMSIDPSHPSFCLLNYSTAFYQFSWPQPCDPKLFLWISNFPSKEKSSYSCFYLASFQAAAAATVSRPSRPSRTSYRPPEESDDSKSSVSDEVVISPPVSRGWNPMPTTKVVFYFQNICCTRDIVIDLVHCRNLLQVQYMRRVHLQRNRNWLRNR